MTRWAGPATVLLVATSIVGAVALAFAARVPDVIDDPLAPDHLNFAGVPIELAFTPSGGGDQQARVPIQIVGDPAWLSRADEIQIAFATFLTSPELRDASLGDASGRCRFTPAPGETLRNNATTRFVRASGCAAPVEALELTVRIGASGRLALWAYDVALTDPVPRGLMLGHTRTHDRGHVLRGRIVRSQPGPGVRRIELASYVWAGDSDTGWLWITLMAIWVALAGGLLLAIRPGRLLPAVGVAIVGGAIAGLWAIVIPPLQGADEPDHLLSYAEVVGRQDFSAPLAVLARRSHFERIRFHGSERFRPADRTEPYAVAWTGDIHSERMDRRSPLTMQLWRLADATVARPRPMAPSELLLRLRLFNAAVFALAIGAAAWLIRTGTASRWAWLALAAIPSLAYFGMAVSDWAFVTSGAVLLAGAMSALTAERGREGTRGAALGLALAWLMSSSIASLALGPLIVVLLGTRVLLGPLEGATPRRAAEFWGTFTVGLALGWWLTSDLLQVGYARYDAVQNTGRLLLDWVNQTMRLVAGAPWIMFIAPLVAAVAEIALIPVRAMTRVTRAAGLSVRVGIGIAGMLLLVVLASSAFAAFPTLRPMEIQPYTSARSYVEAVLAAFVTALRLTNVDHLMFASFWSGFGWIDAILPAPWLAALAAATAGGLVVQARAAARPHAGRSATWMAAVGVGAVAAVAALAVAGFLMRRNVHGRYLICVYTPVILFAWQGWAPICARPGVLGQLTRGALVVGLVALHATALVLVVSRYF